jgi:uncharacterized protein DUF732
MRDRETIDSELRRLAATRRSSGAVSSRRIDELLDERLGHRSAPSATQAVDAPELGGDIWSQIDAANTVAPQRRKRRRRRIGLPVTLPLSLVAVGAALVVVVFVLRHPHDAAQSEDVPPSSEQAAPAAPKPPAPPVSHAPQLPLVDRAFIDTLKQQGVPVPSNDYVLAQGHAVCDFLAHQNDFAEAVRFVQRSTIWDANQSTDFAAGAIISYCPQYQPTGHPSEISDQLQQAFQDAQSDLRAIQGDLQGIRDALPNPPR